MENGADQTVLLRTLATDATSLEQGAQKPNPARLEIPRVPTEASAEAETAKQKKTGKSVLLLILLLILGAVGYFVLYPRLMAALAPQIIE